MIMFEINKTQFGNFLAARRKEKNLTQKELAGKLFISDKAVSKWERGLSLPDISLLIPLAEILELTVTELLEGRIMEHTADKDTQQVEELVKKALAFSDKPPELSKEKKRKRWLVFGACILAVLAEWLVCVCVYSRFLDLYCEGPLVLQILSLFFGAYFWIRAKEHLPAYYDENRICFYNDGFFEMNFPGLCFNNRNWPHILRVCRIWSLLGATVFPICCLLISCCLIPDGEWGIVLSTCILLLFTLGGLFVPVYIVGKKYE